MTLEEAIKMALEYEIRVRDTYVEAAGKATDDTGKRIFKVLGEEEQGHIDYLQCKLDEWKKTGKVTADKLETIVPSQKAIDEGVKKLDKHISKKDYGSEMEMLRKALELEIETSAFYQKMVDQLGAKGGMFAHFLKIEEGHRAIVQAEIDYLNNTGFFFDFQEFSMESPIE
jgi:rubrerythrin